MEQKTETGIPVKKARKVFLSVLGTGFYECCSYHIGEFSAAKTRFVQRATLEYFNSLDEWNGSDCVCIFLTDQARKKNWSVEGNSRKARDGSTVRYTGLKDELEGMGIAASVRGISIPDGGSEEEIWDIFSRIYRELQDGDEVYLDITHALRYIPMLVMVLLEYAKFLKHVKVMGILYGNWENGDKEHGTAPMVDLMPISDLQDWTAAADQYISAGSSEKLNGIYLPEVRRIRRDAALASGSKCKGFKASSNPVVKVSEDLQSLLNSVGLLESEQLTCLGNGVVSGAAALKVQEALGLVRKIGTDTLRLPEPFIPLLDRIGESAESYRPDSIRNLFVTAKACCMHRSYQQALTFLNEGIITFVCMKFDLDWQDDTDRECVCSAFNIIQHSRAEATWQIPGKDDDERISNKELIRRMLGSPAVRAISGRTSRITELRNQYMHCGLLRKTKFSPDNMLKSIESLVHEVSYESLEDAFRKEDGVIFVNFTNHPSEKWSSAQKEAAMSIGCIVDLPFPAVPTDAGGGQLDSMADEYLSKISDLCRGQRFVVHIQGEMTFTYRMVAALKARHIRCVASVTERNTVELGEGKSQSVFVFAGFRDY